MKNISIITALLLVNLILISSCEKDGEKDSVEVDPIEKLKGSVWAGQYHYTPIGKPQYYSIHLENEFEFKWYDISGTYKGQWNVDSNHIFLNFLSGSILSAEIE